MTPKRLRLAYADWCLAVGEEPIYFGKQHTVSIGDELDFILSGDQCTSVILSRPQFDVALNAAIPSGIVIQMGSLDLGAWHTVYRAYRTFEPGAWCALVRAALRARIRPNITPLPLKALG